MISLESLNEPQKNAVTYAGDRHCLILAGAGSGKTRVLTYRIAWLLTQNVPAYAIAAFTFTNKAAAEMRSRAESLTQESGISDAHVQLSTFHAYGARFLRRYCEYVGLTDAFTIYGESEQKTLIKNVMTDLSLLHPRAEILDKEETSENAVKDYYEQIMTWKEKGLSVEAARTLARSLLEINEVNVYELYERRLIENNAVDFAGLLLWPLYILNRYDDVKMRVQSRYRHILVDEFQDTNSVQLDLIQTIAGPQTHITAVGDDDQSIYTWRGADPSAILKFSERFGACEVFKLEQNYRSTKPILHCASDLIAHNAIRTKKKLWTQKDGGEPVHIVSYPSDRDEISSVIAEIRKRHANGEGDWNDFAILFRKNSMSLSFERICAENRIPYQVVAGLAFFERAEIADLMAYLRVIVNPLDRMALRRMINRPQRGVGEKSVERLLDLMEKKTAFGVPPSVCFVELMKDIVSGKCKIPRGGTKLTEGCQSLLHLFERLSSWQTMRPHDVLQCILDETHYLDYLKQALAKKSADYDEAKDRISTLLDTLTSYAEEHDDGLSGFLELMALVRPESDEAQNSIKLMTIHGAKGLEFNVVFIAGAEDGILPLERSDMCDVEEERRLMYVAMTRAKKVLYVSYADKRFEYGHETHRKRSRFIDEMEGNQPSNGMYDETTHQPNDYTRNAYHRKSNYGLAWSFTRKKKEQKTTSDTDDFANEVGNGVSRAFGKRARAKQLFDEAMGYEEEAHDIRADIMEAEPEVPKSPKIMPSTEARGRRGAKLTVGTRVNHAVHGDGFILKIEPSSNDFKVTVRFQKSGDRTILARFLDAL